MLGTGATNLRGSGSGGGGEDGINLHQDIKLDPDLVTKLVLNQFTPPAKYIQKLEIQASDKADKLQSNKPKVNNANIEEEPNDNTQTNVTNNAQQTTQATNYTRDTNFKQTAGTVIARSVLSESLLETKMQAPVERLFRLKVHLHCLPPTLGAGDFAVMELAAPVSMTVEDVIKLTLKTYNEEKRKPNLIENSVLYELRTYSESTFDDDDDNDDFVLDRKSEIVKCGYKVVSLAKAPNVTNDMILQTSDRPSVLPELPQGDLAVLRIIMDSHSLAIKVPKDTTMEKLLSLVGKKKSQVMNWDNWEFITEEKVIDRDTIVGDLKDKNIELRKKVKGQGGKYIPPNGPNEQGMFIFPDRENAAEYKEFEVYKYKNRLKQKRVMGINDKRIYNKAPEQTDTQFTFEGLKGLSLGGHVKRKYRDMTDVVKAETIVDRPRMFQILFRDLESNAIVPYVYEAMTDRDCAEIVAKIEYLRK